jgi:hypothetical protein
LLFEREQIINKESATIVIVLVPPSFPSSIISLIKHAYIILKKFKKLKKKNQQHYVQE